MSTDASAPTMAIFRPDVTHPGVRAGLEAVGGALGTAHAIASSPAWAELGSTAIVVRERPEPHIGVVGHFDEAAHVRLSVLTWQFEHVLPRTMVLTYRDVETAVERLAAALIARFGRDACASFHYAAMPRGGHVVLGLLAYALGLHQDRLDTPPTTTAPLVVVDDCAISGSRLRRYLDAAPARTPVIAATLFATPELRSAAERDERVRAVVSAYDLRDASERRHGAGHEAYQATWRERSTHGYWAGQPQHVVFPWNEPDMGFWNAVSERVERGWRLVAPERCVKNRPAVGTSAPEIQRQSEARGPLHVAPGVLAARFEGRLVLGAAHWSGCLTLEGTAASMWEALVTHGSAQAATAALAHTYDVEPERLEADLVGFTEALMQRGALESERSA